MEKDSLFFKGKLISVKYILKSECFVPNRSKSQKKTIYYYLLEHLLDPLILHPEKCVSAED